MPAAEYIKAGEMHLEILNSKHDLSKFDCSKDDELGLNEFIHDEALQFQEENLGITYLCFYNQRIVGFATLAMGQIEVKQTDVKPKLETNIRDYPALMIGRLATDNNYRGRHVGSNITLWCLSKAKQLSTEVGCKLVIILTNEQKFRFYEGCGFQMIPKYGKKTKKWMYLPIP